jgi:hypothetical protein
MTTLFPGALDAFTNPSISNNMNDVGVLHSDQHANANDAIEALQASVGITGSLNVDSIQYKLAGKQSIITYGAAPASAVATGVTGTVIVSGGFMYVCVATDTWVRSVMATWI